MKPISQGNVSALAMYFLTKCQFSVKCFESFMNNYVLSEHSQKWFRMNVGI
ncbi:hypothetical protein COHCIP112018_05313 [Cohnella sp. JJ-181]|nr:hypothetical protein COHCIP112018_05313 [Cohnella sp. JJ-181]